MEEEEEVVDATEEEEEEVDAAEEEVATPTGKAAKEPGMLWLQKHCLFVIYLFIYSSE